MKKIFFTFLVLFYIFSPVSAENNYDTDYTLIDCVNGDNDTGVAFDKNSPYATLKSGIENTITYINNNVNVAGNEETASGKTFTIKIKCSFDDILNPSININYNGVLYNNKLIIEGISEGSLIIKEFDFRLSNNSGNIIFKNAHFINENKPYFYDYIFPAAGRYETRRHPFSNGIKIIDSYIQLKNGNNIGNNIGYKSYFYRWYNRNYYDSLRNYTNNQIIENSILDIEIDKHFDFRMPVSIKNSKINFRNKTVSGSLSSTGTYDINFLEDGNPSIHTNLNYSVLTSNEIDLGGNNFISEDTTNISFLNNSFNNFSDFNFGGQSVFINNYIENNKTLNITAFHNLYNNIFKSAFITSYDIMNNRRNFSENNISGGLGWIYKRIRDNDFFNIDINSSVLYKELTGKDLINGLGDIYVIFNY